MAKKRKPTLGKAIFNLILGVPTLLRLTKRIGAHIAFEARLAGKSLISLIILACLCALLLTTSWLCLLAILFVHLVSLQWSIQAVLCILLGINLGLLIIIYILMTIYKKRLLFPETRYLIEETRSIYEDL